MRRKSIRIASGEQKMVKCYYCNQKFAVQQPLCQHLQAKHQSNVLLLDAMLSSKHLDYVFNGYEVIDLPDHLRNAKDHEIVNYAKQKGMGLVTKDKECANRAAKCISPVYFINDKTGKIEKLN